MSGTGRGLRVLVSGASGMVGKALVAQLAQPSVLNNFSPQVLRLVRRPTTGPDEVFWDPYEMRIDMKKIEGVDAVVHLAGENVGSGDGPWPYNMLGRWSERKKHHIMESRRRGTTLLAQALASLKQQPRVLVSASGVGYYGNGGDSILTESSPKGQGFLSEVASVWEQSCAKASEAGIRTVNLRFGVILAASDGVVNKLYWPARMGTAGAIGSGQQFTSWVSLPDVLRIIQFAIQRDDLSGPVNACAPEPARNVEFVNALARAAGRPSFLPGGLPMPEPAVKHMFGEMGEETLLVSQRAVPKKLLDKRFKFLHPDIESGMAAAMGC